MGMNDTLEQLDEFFALQNEAKELFSARVNIYRWFIRLGPDAQEALYARSIEGQKQEQLRLKQSASRSEIPDTPMPGYLK